MLMHPVTVHRQRFVDGKGRERVEEVVHCPRQGSLRSANACQTCGHGDPMRFDQALAADVVDCDVAPHPKTASQQRACTALAGIAAGDVCTRDIICAELDAPIRALVRMFEEHVLGAIPVIDRDGALVGIVSPTDLATAGDAKSAADVMTPDPVHIVEATPVTRAAAIMASDEIHHLPVLGWGGRIVGLLSSTDILRYLGRPNGALIPKLTGPRNGPADT
jgi:predicted transcriptional regulator